MDEHSFRRILTTFADNPADVNLAKGQILVQVRDDLVGASVTRRDGDLVINEDGIEQSAQRWIVDRIARLPLLADRILSYVEDEPYFVIPRCEVLDELERNPEDRYSTVGDAMDALTTLLSRGRVGTAAVAYLTSDAGEGKSTVINMLALEQARRFKRKETSWLLLPVSLGGRPFLRFDDVVAASLLNRFRFPMFFESFIELVRLGVVVPALDGFEEMFVESAAGDAASALGNLMSLLQSSGTVLIAARQAYFDYKNLDTQARLYDALSGQSVSFANVRLKRWDRTQFVEYADQRGLDRSDRVYEQLAAQLGADHPMLTRAVLVKRLMDLAQESGSVDVVLKQIDGGATDYFGQLVRPILSREASKWVDKSGEPFRPLLSEEEHMGLLETIALEMWITESAVIPVENLEYAAELFCEVSRKNASETRQVLERIKQHALLVNKGGARAAYQFDHEEFFHYFLGRAVALRMIKGDVTDIKSALRRTSLPQLSVESAAMALRTIHRGLETAVTITNRVCATEPSASLVRENAGSILVRGLDNSDVENITVEGCVFPRDALNGRRLSRITFRRCEFGETEVGSGALTDITFDNCTFDVLFLRSMDTLRSTQLINCTVRAAAVPGSGLPTYDPSQIEAILARCGAAKPDSSVEAAGQTFSHEMDDQLRYTERVLRRFLRATEVNENVLRQATGAFANQFMRDVLPELLKHQVMRQVSYLGSGHQTRYRLGAPLNAISQALKQSEGNFRSFLELFEGKPAQP